MGFVPTSFGGVSAGRIARVRHGELERYLNSGSGETRLIVTVPALSIRHHAAFERAGAGRGEAGLGADDAGEEGTRGRALDLEDALNEATTSFDVTVLPLENLIPLRILNIQVLPPFVGVGILWAMSGTTLNAPSPPAFLNAPARHSSPGRAASSPACS